MFSLSGTWQWLQFHRLARGLLGGIAFVAAVLPAWPLVTGYLWPDVFTVYVLHREESRGQSVWSDFDEGVNEYLVTKQAVLNGPEVKTGSYELLFKTLTWRSDEELQWYLDDILDDRQTLAVVAATNSQDSEVILAALDPDDPPAVVLAAATKNDLLREPRSDEPRDNAKGVFRLVPTNEGQAVKLAAVMRAPRDGEGTERVRVAVLRAEGQNAAFSRDMAQQLRAELEKKVVGLRPADVVVDAAVDPTLTIPRELIELEPEFVVFIGSQTAAAPFVLQTAAMEGVVHTQGVRQNSRPGKIRFLFTDAGMFGSFAAFDGLLERIEGTLPFKAPKSAEGQRVSYQTLGFDATRLIHEVVVQFNPPQRLSRAGLISSLRSRSFVGRAQSYRFDRGENIEAQFHLWVHDGDWTHDPARCQCGMVD